MTDLRQKIEKAFPEFQERQRKAARVLGRDIVEAALAQQEVGFYHGAEFGFRLAIEALKSQGEHLVCIGTTLTGPIYLDASDYLASLLSEPKGGREDG